MNFRILGCAAWTPANGTPDVSRVAPLLRRRMSALTRMSVAVGLDCCRMAGVEPAMPRVVFASRHGEMDATTHLLTQMSMGETLSPTGFSNSVHHAAVGYWSLVTANRQAIRAASGGEASFCYGFLDAIGMLGERDTSAVLLIAADDQLRLPFDSIVEPHNNPYAAAFLLARALPNEKNAFSFRIGGGADGIATEHTPGIPALDFFQWHLKGEKLLELVSARKVWRWEK